MKSFIVFACLLAAASAIELTKWKDCAKKDSESYGVLKRIVLEPCEKEPCKLIKGSTVKGNMTFVPKFDAASLKAEVHGVILGLPAPFPLPDPDACNDNNLVCPIKAGETYNYVESLKVESYYPSLSLTAKWELFDGKRQVFCFTFPTSVASA